DRALRGEKRLRGGALFRPRPAPDLASGALLLVVHGVDPPLRGRAHDRSEAPACGARLLAALRGGFTDPRRKLRRPAARLRLQFLELIFQILESRRGVDPVASDGSQNHRAPCQRRPDRAASMRVWTFSARQISLASDLRVAAPARLKASKRASTSRYSAA